MHRELVLDLAELSDMIIPCQKCGTRVMIRTGDPESRTPEECPSCGEGYDPAFRETLQTLRQVYRKLADPKARSVQFRLVSEFPKP